MMPRFWILLGGILGGTAVAAGAFGVHAFSPPEKKDIWYLQNMDAEKPALQDAGLWRKQMDLYETAARYHMYNALAMVACGILALVRKSLWAELAGLSFGFGFLLFCLPLYGMFFGGSTMLGAVAPFGGISMMAGWGLISVAAVKGGPQSSVADEEDDDP